MPLAVAAALLVRTVGRFEGQFALRCLERAVLLDHVGELVSDEAPPAVGRRPVLAGREHDVASHGVCECAQRLGGRRRPVVGVDPHAAEVVYETSLEELSLRGAEGLTRRAQRLVHGGRNGPALQLRGR